MDSFAPVEKLTASSEDDNQIQAMVNDYNSLADRYNSKISSGAKAPSQAAAGTDELQALYIQIVNYRKKIEKIRMGY